MDFRALWEAGKPLPEFMAAAKAEHRPLWEGVYRTAHVPEWAMVAPGEERRLLALVEDWCIDTSSTIPVLARWTEMLPGVSLRVLSRDAHPELMNRYLTNGARSIPIVIALDRNFNELAHWGPYPAPLAEWVRDHKPPALPKAEFVKGKRVWYAKDRGETTLRELSAVVAGPSPEPAPIGSAAADPV